MTDNNVTLNEMFKVIPPGNRFIAGSGDTSPPVTDFQRLVHIGERFEKEIMLWCQKAAEALHAKGKLLLMHPDGENKGLMDLIPRCNMDVAEAVAPYPMTKVTLPNTTTAGAVPEN